MKAADLLEEGEAQDHVREELVGEKVRDSGVVVVEVACAVARAHRCLPWASLEVWEEGEGQGSQQLNWHATCWVVVPECQQASQHLRLAVAP